MKYAPKIIGLKLLREKMAHYAAKVQQGESFVVVKQSKPLFKIGPVTDAIFSNDFLQSLDRAEADVAAERVTKIKSLDDLEKKIVYGHRGDK